MPSADQVPVKLPHSTMRRHEWVVLTARSTGSALCAVRPPNLHITPDVRRDLITPLVALTLIIAIMAQTQSLEVSGLPGGISEATERKHALFRSSRPAIFPRKVVDF
jgi:hypothetical protein